MMQFFYHTRNIFGPFLILSPLFGFLFLDKTLFFWFPVLFGATLGCFSFPFSPKKFSLHARFSLCLTVALVSLTVFSLPFPLPSLVTKILYFLFGASIGPLLLLFPSIMIIGWFPRSKTHLLGTLWFLSLTASVFWNLLLTAFPAFGLTSLWLSLIVGFHLCSQIPPFPFQRERGPLDRPPSYTAKSYLFLLPVVSAPFLCLTLLQNETTTPSPYTGFLFIPLFLSPLLFSYFIERKGVFSSCVLLVFLQEIALLCLIQTEYPYLPILGIIFVSVGFSAITVVLPILSLYLYGLRNLVYYLSKLMSAIPFGVGMTLYYIKFDPTLPLYSEMPTIFFLLLLTVGFLCIFFVWKGRFIILKNKTM